MEDVFAAVDLSGALTGSVAALVVVIGVALAFKGAGLGKRAIKHA
jgi:hypothetical protein